MNKTVLSASVAAILGTATMGAQADLGASAVLDFDAGVTSCVAGAGTPPNACNYGTKVGTNANGSGFGSWFGMDTNGDSIMKAAERVAISAHDGVHMGVAQTASGSHSGLPFGSGAGYTGTNFVQIGVTVGETVPIFMSAADTTGGDGGTTDTSLAFVANTTEVPGVDEPWNFFGNTGMHYLSVGPTVTGGAGTNNLTLDFSGWGVTWNGIPAIPMSGGAWEAGFSSGVAKISCSLTDCSQSSTFSLDYSATVPAGDPSGFGGVKYALHLEGHVGGTPATVVPVPAAVWLFGSGLLGLAGVARRKKA